MDKAGLIGDEDARLLHEFSRRSLEHLTGKSPLSLAAPFIATYMDANVRKEIEKDRLIIHAAVAAFEKNETIDGPFIDAVFNKTREVDSAFVRKLSFPSIIIHIHYDDFAHIRKQRIECIARAVKELLQTWGPVAAFPEAARRAFQKKRFEGLVTEILHLYNLETRLLSGSIKFLPPLNQAMDLFMETVYECMEETTTSLVDCCTNKVYGGEAVHDHS